MSLLTNRKAVYEAARKARPGRWSRQCRQWQHEGVVMLTPGKP